MKPITQTTLPGIRDFREPQIVSAQRLASMITEANAAGFDAIRMECIRNPLGYRVTFQRMQDASEGRGARPVQNLAQVPDGVLPNRSKESL